MTSRILICSAVWQTRNPAKALRSHRLYLYCAAYAPIPDWAAIAALMPPARRIRLGPGGAIPGPLFAYALLALAAERHFSIDSAAAVAYTDKGKPYFPDLPLHLSLSHSKTHALCVLADHPVGCDIETHRPISAKVKRRVLANAERPSDFFAHWALKESYIKLGGHSRLPFSSLSFSITGDRAQGQDCHGFLYRQIPNCTAAVLAHTPFEQPAVTLLDPETLFSYAAKKRT